MEIRVLTAGVIFFGSYFPLALILFVQDFNVAAATQPFCSSFKNLSDTCALPLSHPWTASVILLASGLCFMVFLFALRITPSTNEVNVHETKHIPADLMSYVFPYIVSFMSFDYASIPKMIGGAIFLLWMFLVTFRTGNIALNPLLAVFGWRLFEIKFSYPLGVAHHLGRALSKDEIEPNSRYEVFAFQDVLLAKKKD